MKGVRSITEKLAWCKLLFLPHDLARKIFFGLLNSLSSGGITIKENGETYQFGQSNDLSATVTIHKKSTYSDLVFGGSLGAGESFMRGDWTVDDLPKLMRLFCRDLALVNRLDSGLAMVVNPMLRFFNRLKRNTVGGSRENIEAHYDLGKEFFELFLDESMTYSAAIFPNAESSLHEAQLNKLKLVCDKLQLKSTDHLLEIGTGWGSLAIFAAENYGCRVTTATISPDQVEVARERIKAKGLDDRITVLASDYRDLTGQYDKLASIEMIEAVGHQYLPVYFESCSRLLKPDGLFLLQVITVPGRRYDKARKQIDFIKRYVFPGSCIPSVQKMMDCIEGRTDLRLLSHQDFSPHYAKTLREWRLNLVKRRDEAIEMSNLDFYRMWLFYLSYCEGGFEEYFIGSAQMLFAKPYNRLSTALDSSD